jgi:hypothetical protein
LDLHGFDACNGFWHGPTEIARPQGRPGAILTKLRRSPGNFHGKLTHRVPGAPSLSFHASVYDLRDSGLAVIDFDAFDGGPAAVLSIIPAARRPLLRQDFAFSFVSFWHFRALHVSPDAEMKIHDYMEAALKAEPGRSLAFSVESEPGESEASITLAACIEDLSRGVHEWLCTRDAAIEQGLRLTAGEFVPGSPHGHDPARKVSLVTQLLA